MAGNPISRARIANLVGMPAPGSPEKNSLLKGELPSTDEMRREALGTLRSVMAKGEDRDRVQAARVLLAATSEKGKGEDLSALSDEQVEQMAKGAGAPANQQAKG